MSEIFGKFDTQDLNRKSALDIFEKLRPIRQGINKEFIARRLIWELIQNAKDNVAVCNSNGDKNLSIELNLTNDKFIFSHNKGYFKNENVRGLIRRYSSSDKDRNETNSEEAPATTGRFGTGFMTTHLLSELVEIKAVFQENNETFKPFTLILDRTGHNVPELINGIEKAFTSVETSVSNSSTISPNVNEFKSEFIYHLNNVGLELAKIAVEELKNTAAYSLINHPNIKSIKYNGVNTIFDFKLSKINSIQFEETEIIFYELNIQKEQLSKYYVSVGCNETKIIFPIQIVENEILLLSVEKEVPKVFLDFPLIGTEELHIPFVINSPFFEPTEPRDGISLTGGTDEDTQKNVAVFNEAFRLYNIFINYVQSKFEWKNLYNLADIRKPKEKDWVNTSWYEETYIKPTRETLLTKYIVDTVRYGRRAITGKGTVDFPSSVKKEIREKLWILCNIGDYFILPNQEHIHKWYEIIWKKEYELTVEKIVKWIETKQNISRLSTSLGKTESGTIDWLNEVIALVNDDETLLAQLNQDKLKVLPNQNGLFQVKSKLLKDDGIEENLKSVMITIGNDWKNFLLHQSINDFTGIIFNSKDQDSIIIEINRILNEGENSNINKACIQLACLFPKSENKIRSSIYTFSKRLFPNEIGEIKSVPIDNPSIWVVSDKLITKRIVTTIGSCNNVETLKTKFSFQIISETLKWLDELITFLEKNQYENLLNLKTAPILPNQNGDFKYKDILQTDNTEEVAEDLKDISKLLGYDFRNELLAKEIFPVLPEKQVVEIKAIADKITVLIELKLGSIERDDAIRELFRKLFLWFNKNKYLAEQIFTKLYERKHRLIDDDEIAENLEKAEIFDEIFGETGLLPKEIKDKLKALLTNPNIADILKTPTEAILPVSGVLYPVGSEDDIAISLSLIDNSSEKSRISVSEDAKEIIFQTLKEKGFRFSENLKIKYTIVDGILSPNGNPIKIIIKSAKAGKIYFNPNEWLTLTEPDSQLFVVTRGDVVRNVTLSDIESINDTFHMRLNTQSFALANLKEFVKFFQYLPYTHFIFETPESSTDYLRQFGLSERNPSSTELSTDDKNLLL
ncbi:MAG: hypothetical protein KA340_09455 [Saprospiraceae bacterium]|nr:hypothetical protein [Candidatus Vicinibacter affinis]MBP6398096.1 hypothetical protein [Saprospiraceae bacterium]